MVLKHFAASLLIDKFYLRYISSLLLRLHKLLSLYYWNGLGNLDSLSSNKEVCFWFKSNLDRRSTPKFNLTRVQTHDLSIMTDHFMPLRCFEQTNSCQWFLKARILLVCFEIHLSVAAETIWKMDKYKLLPCLSVKWLILWKQTCSIFWTLLMRNVFITLWMDCLCRTAKVASVIRGASSWTSSTPTLCRRSGLCLTATGWWVTHRCICRSVHKYHLKDA